MPCFDKLAMREGSHQQNSYQKGVPVWKILGITNLKKHGQFIYFFTGQLLKKAQFMNNKTRRTKFISNTINNKF